MSLATIKEIISIKELRKRLLYTVFFAFIYRLGSFVPLPFLDPKKILEVIKSKEGASVFDKLIGTSMVSYSIFSLGISPYITASIIVYMGKFVFAYFQRLEQEGAAGKLKRDRLTRQLTVVIALLQSIPTVLRIQNRESIILGYREWGGKWFYLTSILLMTASAIFSLWLADRITEKGVGNGTSVLLLVGIMGRLPEALAIEIQAKNILVLTFEFALFFAIVLGVIFFTNGIRKVPLQYARQRGFTMTAYGGAHHHLPIKTNMTGIMPLISANMVVSFVVFISDRLRGKLNVAGSIADVMGDTSSWQCNLVQALLVFAGSFAYTAIFIDPRKIANDLKKNNGFIPGIKPGAPTAHYIDKIMSRIVFCGGLFLAFVVMLPAVTSSDKLGISKELSAFYGGTSLLIIINVILEIAQQIEAYWHRAQYDRLEQFSKGVVNL